MVTLSLMVLLVILALGLLSLSTVTLRSGSVSSAKQDAESNARMALNIALGQLQAAAGPDQRITARAEILDSDPSTPAVDTVKQPYWTGVWQTGNASLDDKSNGPAQRSTSLGSTDPTSSGVAATKVTKAAAWLVSMTPTTTIDPIAGTYNGLNLTVADDLTSLSASASNSGVTGSATNPTAVILAKKIGRKDPSAPPSGTTNPGFIVAAPLVTINAKPPGLSSSRPIGKYAYWVADEGVKAKVNLIDPTLAATSTDTTAQAHFLAPQANAIHKMNGLVTDSSQDFRTSNVDQLPKVITPGQMALLPTTPSGLNLKPYLSDITTYSQGILADVKNGGLKKDLTAAFESTAGYNKLTGASPDYGFGAAMLYRNYKGLTIPYSTKGVNSYNDGLKWISLYSYYNIYKTMMPPPPDGTPVTGGPQPTTTGSLTSLPYQISPRTLSILAPKPYADCGGLVPELISIRMDIALESYLKNPGLPVSNNNPYKLSLRYYPQLVLYNPYNCKLKPFTAGDLTNCFVLFGGLSIEVKVGGTLVTTSPIRLNPSTNTVESRLQVALGDIAPGESQVLGLTGDVKAGGKLVTRNGIQGYDYTPMNFWGGSVKATGVSLSPQNAQTMDLPVSSSFTGSGQFYLYGDPYPGTSNGDDLVTVTLRSNNSPVTNFSCGGGWKYIGNWQWPTGCFGYATFQANAYFPYQPLDTDWAPIPISSLNKNPRMIIGNFYRKKGLAPSSTGASYINGTNAVPLYHGNAAAFQIFDNSKNFSSAEITAGKFGQPFSSSTEIQQIQPSPSSGPWTTYFGDDSVGLPTGAPTKRVLRDVPGQPLISLGQFMHMPTSITGWWGDYTSRSSGSMFIGGSLCSPFIPTANTLFDQTPLPWTASNTRLAYLLLDDSYLSNDTLFDRFYFSTVPPPAPLDAQAPQQWRDFNAANPGTTLSDASKPLPNSRIKPYYANGVAPQMSDLRDFDKAAANLLLEGAFNVNSTSIDAWKALLSSLSGKDNMRVYNPDTKATESINFINTAKPNPIPRFLASRGTVNAATGAWDGARSFSDAEITQLATRIVEQVKLRGPFLSMSDFLNRRLGAANPFTRAGCLQAAIDNTSLNNKVKTAGRVATTTASEIIDPNAPTIIPANMVDGADGAGNPLNTTVGMPGYLMQQDLVQAFSPAMTVRSDTFVIRAYGESINPVTGATQAKAWAEAVVQRTTEFIDNQNAPDPSAALASLNSTNQKMGRRFKVIGFRWLTPNDL